MSEIRILNLCHKKTILVDIYRQSLLKADYKLHVLEESPCADHCIRFALSSDDVQYKTACDHEHTMQCDRCLDCANVAHDIISGLDSGDISFR